MAAAPSTLFSPVPTYVPRVSLNSKIFLMSSACFFQEELLSPFSRAMADEGSEAARRRGRARGAGAGALRRGRPVAEAQEGPRGPGRAAWGCSAREPEETWCCGRASSSAVSSFTLAAAAVPPWLLFLLFSGTDFLPPLLLARLLCSGLPASLSATFLPPFPASPPPA